MILQELRIFRTLDNYTHRCYASDMAWASIFVALLSVSCAAVAGEPSRSNLIRVGEGYFSVKSARAGHGPVTITLEGSKAKPQILRNYRLQVGTNGKIAELPACGETALGPSCIEIETASGRYHLPPLGTLYIGDEKPTITLSFAGKRKKIILPMEAGRISSIAVSSGGIRLVLYAQPSLGRRNENGRELFGVAHEGVYKVVEIASDSVTSLAEVKEEPRP